MGSGLLAAVFGAMLAGGPILAWLAIKRAPLERDRIRVDQSATVADEALALLAAERERFAEAVERLTAELEAVRRDRAHDQEQCRQLTVANEALRDELAEADRELARLKGTT